MQPAVHARLAHAARRVTPNDAPAPRPAAGERLHGSSRHLAAVAHRDAQARGRGPQRCRVDAAEQSIAGGVSSSSVADAGTPARLAAPRCRYGKAIPTASMRRRHAMKSWQRVPTCLSYHATRTHFVIMVNPCARFSCARVKRCAVTGGSCSSHGLPRGRAAASPARARSLGGCRRCAELGDSSRPHDPAM